jgi:hypothetical protein
VEKTDAMRSTPQKLPTRGHSLPSGIAELTAFHGPLPSWYRYDVGARDPELTPHRAFEMLVSAACYLANGPEATLASDGEACVLLKQCVRSLRDEVAEISSAPEEIETQIWQEKQIRWKRHRRLFGPEEHNPPEKPFRQPSGGVVARWRARWRGTPTVVAL